MKIAKTCCEKPKFTNFEPLCPNFAQGFSYYHAHVQNGQAFYTQAIDFAQRLNYFTNISENLHFTARLHRQGPLRYFPNIITHKGEAERISFHQIIRSVFPYMRYPAKEDCNIGLYDSLPTQSAMGIFHGRRL